jgi:hypothetical protein
MAKAPDVCVTSVRDWVRKYGNAVLDDPTNGIIGIGVGKKSTGALDDDSSFCVTGFVQRKLTRKQLKARAIPEFSSSFTAISGSRPEQQALEIDVVDAGSTFSATPKLRVDRSQRGPYGGPPPSVDLQKKFEATRGGIGITNPAGAYPEYLSVGTLGFIVCDPQERLYLVSNNHVIANENDARKGNVIVQPGTLDLTDTELDLMDTLARLRNQLRIAKLSAWVDIEFPTSTQVPFNEVDCAIAEIEQNRRSVTEVARIGLGGVSRGLGPDYRVDADSGRVAGSTRVYKAGRTTGWTEGEVVALNVLTDVEYGAGVARFRNQIAIKPTADNTGPFSDSGDSGSGIYNQAHKLVALLFAGSATRTLANPARKVMSALESALGRGRLTVVRG